MGSSDLRQDLGTALRPIGMPFIPMTPRAHRTAMRARSSQPQLEAAVSMHWAKLASLTRAWAPCVRHNRHRMPSPLPVPPVQVGFCGAELSRFPDSCVRTPLVEFAYGPARFQPTEVFRMRKLIIATAALAFVSSAALAQSTEKPMTTTGQSAKSGDAMGGGDDMKMSKTKKKSAKKSSGDAMSK